LIATPASGLSRRAEVLGGQLPPLLVAAERIAATITPGVHGRRRVGQGDSFWQFRPFQPGDAVNRIDWRQSAKSDRAYIRETEWEAAQTVVMWCDTSASMRWKSTAASAEKLDRARLLALALASLLLRGGERVTILGQWMPVSQGRQGLERLGETLLGGDAEGAGASGMPPNVQLPRFARMVMFSDFLGPLGEVQESVARLAGIPVTGHLVQILDPAEATLPYNGRVRFSGLEHEADEIVPRVEGIRDAYTERLVAQQAGLSDICAAAGFGFTTHRSDHGPETALLALHAALAMA
jgi:uncharacterized protein (DUF58 family)